VVQDERYPLADQPLRRRQRRAEAPHLEDEVFDRPAKDEFALSQHRW
jgi:hypothetical protein